MTIRELLNEWSEVSDSFKPDTNLDDSLLDAISSYTKWMYRTSVLDSDEFRTIYIGIPGLTKDKVSIIVKDDMCNVTIRKSPDLPFDIEGKYTFSVSFKVRYVEAFVTDGILTILIHKELSSDPIEVEIK